MGQIYSLTDANVSVQFAKAAERRYQDGLDRSDARDAAVDSIRTELTLAVLGGMAGVVKTVPSYRRANPLQIVETTQNIHDAIAESMDAMECAELLALVLSDSSCPLVARMRLALAERYARDNCEEIAEARGYFEG